MAEITDRIESVGLKTIDSNTICHMLESDWCVKRWCGVPIEEERQVVPRAEIEGYFDRLMEVVDGMSAHFDFNVERWAIKSDGSEGKDVLRTIGKLG
jgi:hypothetical protein